MRHPCPARCRVIRWLAGAIACLLALAPSQHAHAEDECGWIPTFGAGAASTDPTVYAAVPFDGTTYLLGNFTAAGGSAAAGVVRWNGTTWEAVPGTPFEQCMDGVVFDDGTGPALYCFGRPTDLPGLGYAVRRWDGGSWSQVGGVFSKVVSTLDVIDLGSGPALYCGGVANNAVDGVPKGNVMVWSGSAWQPVGDGLIGAGTTTATVYALAAFDGGSGPRLYAGGAFASSGSGASLNHLARLEGGQWQPVGGGVNDTLGGNDSVTALLSVPDDTSGQPSLYVGGVFNQAGAVATTCLARWAGNAWHAALLPGTGTGCIVRCIARLAPQPGSPARLYAAGVLNRTTGLFMAYQDGASWLAHPGAFAPGSTGEYQVYSLSLLPGSGGASRLMCAGWLGSIDNVKMYSTSVWDGTRWLPSSAGLNGPIHASVLFDDGQGGGPALYIGGEADGGAGAAFGYVAKWTGATWQKLGAGLNGPVYALTVFDDGNGPRLVAGGAFTKSGAVDVVRVARWSGSSWTPMGIGVGSQGAVYGFASFVDTTKAPNKTLYAMGTFNTPPGLARFDDNAWRQVGAFSASIVRCGIVWDDGNGEALWIGGASLFTGGESSGPLARFDGINWTFPPGSPTGGVYAMTTLQQPGQSSSKLIVAGDSLFFGPIVSRVASWDGTTWRRFQDQFNDRVYALTTIYDPNTETNVVVAGGTFTVSNGTAMNGVSLYNGYGWISMGAGTWGKFPQNTTTGVRTLINVPAAVIAPGASGQTLVVGGGFTSTSSGDGGLARWNVCAQSADQDGNGIVNGTDLGLLLGSWGPCAGCIADLNSDGQVNGTDLGILLGAWTQ